jgi:hypothetical protein
MHALEHIPGANVWHIATYEYLGRGADCVAGWMLRRGGGNRADKANSIFVPMKWSLDPPRAVFEIVTALNSGNEREERVVA